MARDAYRMRTNGALAQITGFNNCKTEGYLAFPRIADGIPPPAKI